MKGSGHDRECQQNFADKQRRIGTSFKLHAVLGCESRHVRRHDTRFSLRNCSRSCFATQATTTRNGFRTTTCGSTVCSRITISQRQQLTTARYAIMEKCRKYVVCANYSLAQLLAEGCVEHPKCGMERSMETCSA